MHMFSTEHKFYGGHGIVGAQVSLGGGLALAHQYNDDGGFCLAYFGDGAANQGQVYETMNMAALWKLPILFVVENNTWGIGMDHNRATSDPEIWRKAAAFGMAGEEVDGMDVLAVRAAAQRAIERARAGEGPTLLECLTYRFRGHSLADPDDVIHSDR